MCLYKIEHKQSCHHGEHVYGVCSVARDQGHKNPSKCSQTDWNNPQHVPVAGYCTRCTVARVQLVEGPEGARALEDDMREKETAWTKAQGKGTSTAEIAYPEVKEARMKVAKQWSEYGRQVKKSREEYIRAAEQSPYIGTGFKRHHLDEPKDKEYLDSRRNLQSMMPGPPK